MAAEHAADVLMRGVRASGAYIDPMTHDRVTLDDRIMRVIGGKR
jgi:hypothetical protein